MANLHTPGMLHDQSEQYDSTWEDDEGDLDDTTQRSWGPHRNRYAAEDMQIYRHYYQIIPTDDRTDDDMEDDTDSPNVQFYRNKIRFYPDGVYIDDFHEDWAKDYDRLEYVHSYIQWLFPIQEKGMNYASQELSLKEIKLFRRDAEMKRRLLKSYKIMLNFYGIELVSKETGEVKRADNWGKQFENLNRNTHNSLRITRIIKCLGLLGFCHYQAPLVRFFLEETLVNGELQRVKQSVLDYFMFAVLNKPERKELVKFAFCNFKPKEKFVWCPRRIRKKFLKKNETESPKLTAGTNEGVSSDSTSQSDQNNLMYSGGQNNEIKTDTNDDTSTEKSLISESRNDENVSDKCQDSEKQMLPVPTAGNANTTNTNDGTEAASGVDSQHEGHRYSEDIAAIQKNDSEETNKKIPNKSDENGSENADSTSDESTNENFTQTSNYSSTSENVAKEPPVSGRNSGSEQEDHENQGDGSEQGSKDELKSQHSDRDSKENDSEKSGSESPEDSVATEPATNEANSAHCHAEKSEDKNSHKYTLPPGEANASSRSFEQNENEQQESDQGHELLNEPNLTANFITGQLNKDAQSKCGPIPHCAVQQPLATLMKSPGSDENMGNLHKGSDQQNQSDVKMLNQLKDTAEANTKEQSNEKKEDPVHQSMEDNTEDRFTDDRDSNAVTSHNNENSDSTDVKDREDTESEQGTALKRDVNSSPVIPGKDTETGESSKEKSVEDKKTKDKNCV